MSRNYYEDMTSFEDLDVSYDEDMAEAFDLVDNYDELYDDEYDELSYRYSDWDEKWKM